ncbi:MAG: PHP domain-containing protein [Candidatus Gastranaerophilales bacterium]|nr:PHP domain-containing protein [Candidatus Gastranaerophilales bacterium]MCM1073159.1 PHP domain-containing protein [Bacteroides sp.]
MINIRDLKEEDFKNKKVDLHIHTTCSDGEGDYNQILQSAKEKGYKLIAITDHNSIEAHKQIQDGILVTGVEFDCWAGYVFIHLLAYGIDINHPAMQPFYAKNKAGTEGVLIRLLPTRSVKKLIKAIHEAGGIAVLAHPACCWAISLENLVKNLMKLGLDGIEAYYPYPRFRKFAKFHSAKDVLKIAEKYPELIRTGGTDFHGKEF